MRYGAIYVDIANQKFIDRVILAAFDAKMFTAIRYRWLYDKDTRELDSFIISARGNSFVVYLLSKITKIRVPRLERKLVYCVISEPDTKDSR